MKRAFPTAISAIVVFLSACSQLAPIPEGPPAVGGFEVSGRVAVRYGNESATGRVQWRHDDSADDLLITNPLGQGVARVTRSGQEVQLQTNDGRSFREPDAETLTEKVLGWRLPLAGLADWILARPRPGRPSQVSRAPSGRISELRQDDWRIEYEDYADGRPSRMKLSRPDLEIRLVVESWRSGS